MEETKTTETQQQTDQEVLWVNVPWATINKTTKALTLTGNVAANYLVHALSDQVVRLEQEVIKMKDETKTQEVPTEKL